MIFRKAVYAALEPSARLQKGLSPTNKLLAVLIIVASLCAILETERPLKAEYGSIFEAAELVFAVAFLIEYALRLWSIAEADESVWLARLKFAMSPTGLLDLVVIVASLLPFITVNVAILRIVRLIRILRLAKLGRMSRAMANITKAVHARRYELALTAGLAGFLMLIGATALYLLEGELQPDKFGSIPRALWWSVITLTTIGYGDVYPVTTAGKLVASFVAIAGIGLIAMPTGILAAAFSDVMQGQKD
jgi:voltage-gated potassium channel